MDRMEGYTGNFNEISKYLDRRSMEDIAYTTSHIPTGVPFCGRISPAGEGIILLLIYNNNSDK
jgi:hypothetical protein